MITKKNPVFLRNASTLSIMVICILLCSCVTRRKLEYVRDRNSSIKTFKEVVPPEYRLKANDELYIQINSVDEASSNVFSNVKQDTYVGSLTPFGASLMSISVDKEGYVFLPVLGKIMVMDKTLSEVTQIIKTALSHILNQPGVSVKLVNRYISVLGEVKNPGHYPYSQDKLTIYDALSLAGDITDYGNRKQVILVRNENGENLRINIDLTQSEILKSEYLNLRPNDLVYVKQVRQKFWNISQVPISLFLTAITTGLLLYTIIKP